MEQTPQSVTNSVMFTRRVVCAMIEQAVWDSRSDRGHGRAYLQNLESQHRQEANYFLSSTAFEYLCSVLGLPADRIRGSVGLPKQTETKNENNQSKAQA